MRKIATTGFVLGIFAALTLGHVRARDVDGRYANSPLHDWFENLKSGKGPCCSDADGTKVDDPDWTNNDGHYRVKVDGIWFDVPPEAVITEPNKVGITMVWPLYYYVNGEPDKTRPAFGIRCFMPGPLA